MSKIFKYEQFINEKYESNPEYRIKSFFDELEKNIREWFNTGSLKTTILGDIKRALTNSMEKNLIFEFSDDKFYYQVYIIISLQNVEEDNLGDCYVKVKKYDGAELKLLRVLGEDVSVKNLNEDTILKLFAKLDDESSSLDIEQGNVTISDEDSDLEDTDLV